MVSSSQETHPGGALGLPAAGVGSVASMAARIGAFLTDLLISFMVAWLFTRPDLPQNWSLLVWATMTVLAVGVFGFTPGHLLFGIRVASTAGSRFVGWWALPRAALVFVIVPPLFTDADSRGLHDRWCRTVVVRTR
jgi:uncharacterized RDD family membrane protein YckC